MEPSVVLSWLYLVCLVVERGNGFRGWGGRAYLSDAKNLGIIIDSKNLFSLPLKRSNSLGW